MQRRLMEALEDMNPLLSDAVGAGRLNPREQRHASRIKKLMGANADVAKASVGGSSIYDPGSHTALWHKTIDYGKHMRMMKKAGSLDQKHLASAMDNVGDFTDMADAQRKMFPRSMKVNDLVNKHGRRNAYTLAHELAHSKEAPSGDFSTLKSEALANAGMLNPKLGKKSLRNQTSRVSMAQHLKNERNTVRGVGGKVSDVNKRWKSFRAAGGFDPRNVAKSLHLLQSLRGSISNLVESLVW